MQGRGSDGLAEGLASAFLEACPEAFIAVDRQFRVIAWNRSAEQLFGWTAEEVIGQEPPHVDAGTLSTLRSEAEEELVQGLPAFEHRLRKDGSTVPVVIERETEIRSADGTLLGWGRFARRATSAERLVAERNEMTWRLAEAVSPEAVHAVLREAVHDLLQAQSAVVLRPTPETGVLAGRLGLGCSQASAEALQLEPVGPPGRALTEGIATAGHVTLDGRQLPAVFVPMGPRRAREVLAVVCTGEGSQRPSADLAVGFAVDAWTALRRVELLTELQARLEVMEATTAVSAAAGLELGSLLSTVCERVSSALSCPRVGIYLRDHSGALALAAEVGLDSGLGEGTDVAESLSLTAEPAAIADGADLPDGGPWSLAAGTGALGAFPLAVGERSLGVLLAAKQPGHGGFTGQSLTVGSAMAQQASLALDNARMFAAEQEAVRRLEVLDEVKRDRLAGISHDLKTPLTGLLGFVQTLRRAEEQLSADERLEFLAIMERQAQRVVGMVEDLLVGARIEAGKLAPDTHEVIPLAAVVDDILELLPAPSQERIDVEVREHARTRGDRAQLQRLVQNLVDNALKHAPASRVLVRVRIDDGDAVLDVRDSGPGMEPATMDRAFERFEAWGATGSTGLGLAIVRGIVEGHGGSVELDTHPGVGTHVAVRLPLVVRPGAPSS